jgi:hypothetical protein
VSPAKPKRTRIERRSLHSASSVERYLQAGVVPRFIERANQIESGMHRHRKRLERAYDWAREHHGQNPDEFARYWTELAETWRFDDLNDLIDEHNQWYPAERRLPMNPRTGDYMTIGNRDWRRRRLDAGWILEQFPVENAA